jgi:uncharacterized membrane protein YccF (DUF307 family)
MSCLGNLIWLVFGGFMAGIGYILGGLVVCLTVVGAPFGVQAIKLGTVTMFPFGRQLIVTEEASQPLYVTLNILWAIFFGWEIAVAHLTSALLLAITIIGLPFARQHMKLLPLSLAPFGRELT